MLWLWLQCRLQHLPSPCLPKLLPRFNAAAPVCVSHPSGATLVLMLHQRRWLWFRSSSYQTATCWASLCSSHAWLTQWSQTHGQHVQRQQVCTGMCLCVCVGGLGLWRQDTSSIGEIWVVCSLSSLLTETCCCLHFCVTCAPVHCHAVLCRAVLCRHCQCCARWC